MSGILSHAWGESAAADRIWAQVSGFAPSSAASRQFMVLQAYIDDSTDQSGVYVLAGYIASAQKWAEFSREWEEMLPWATMQRSGRYAFKMSQMATLDERMDRVGSFANIINKHVDMSVAAIINTTMLNDSLNDLNMEICYSNGDSESLDISTLKNRWRNPFFFCISCVDGHLYTLQ